MRVIVLLAIAAAVPPAFAQSPAERAEAARRLLLAGKMDEAIAVYKELARAAPNDAGMALNLAIAEYTAKRFPDAARDAETAARLRPDLVPAYLFIGGSYLELGEPAKAVAPLEKAVAGMPGDRNAPLMLGEALLGVGRYADALDYLRRSSEALANSPRVWYGLGQVYDALAEQTAAEIQKSGTDPAAAQAVAADVAARHTRYGTAFQGFRKALEIEPSLAGAHAGLARVYRATGHPEWAKEEDARETRAAKPADGPYASYLSYRALAAEAYDRLDQLPDSLQRHLRRARQLDAVGDHTAAATEWREAARLAPGNAQVQAGLAWALFRTRDYNAALAIADALLKADPASVEGNFLRGASLVNQERPEAALPYLRTAVARDEQFVPARAALGQALLRTGKASDAIPYLRGAVAVDEDGSTRFQLFRAYQVAGDKADAAKALADYQAFRAARAEALAREEQIRITAP